MAIGFRNSSGVDFDDLFAPYTSGTKPAATGFRNSSGTDIKDLYQPGNSGYTVGFKNSAGTDVGALFAKKSGATPASVVVSPSTDSQSAARPASLSQTFTATVSNGVGPFTYNWYFSAGGTGITLSGTTTASCLAQSTVGSGVATITRSGTLRCDVTDTGNGSLVSYNVANISWTFTGSGGGGP